MLRRFLCMSCLAAVAVAVACYESGAEVECTRACTNASACRLLPSPLGGGPDGIGVVDNCAARCEITDPDQRSVITRCLANGPDGAPEGAWCGEGGAGADLVCDRAAACLVGQFGGAILGKATIDVLVVQPTADAGGGGMTPIDARSRACAAAPCDSTQCQGSDPTCDRSSCSGALESTAATDWCTSAHAAFARAFVVQNTERFSTDFQTCAPALAQSTTFQGLEPGPARPGVQIRGALPLPVLDGGLEAGLEGGVGAAPYCWVVYGPRIVLGANSGDRAIVPIPAANDSALIAGTWPYTCEESADACSDGADNDGNGFADCADVQCRPFCLQAAQQCDGGAVLDGGPCAVADAATEDSSRDATDAGSD